MNNEFDQQEEVKLVEQEQSSSTNLEQPIKENTNTLDVELNDQLFKFVELSDTIKSSSLVGKPRIAIVDIFKRFFKNYVAVIALCVVLLIALIGLIAPLASPFSATEPASSASRDWISNMPPGYAPIVTEIMTQSQFEEIKKVDDLMTNLQIIKNYQQLENQFLVTYDKYLFVSSLTNDGSSGFTTLLGTNNVGIDIWTRTWVATRDSITLAFLVATTDAVIGITIGALLGFHAGKWVDTVFTRIIEIIINIPSLIWFLMLITILPTINQFSLFLILTSIGWVYMVNGTRLWIITVKDQDFIMAAKSIGASKARQIFVHALPAVIGKLATNYVRRIVVVIVSLSSLTFLGFLPTTGSPNLGTLLQEARTQFGTNIWILLLPSMILLFFSLSSQFIANGLHDALDPQVIRGK